MSCSVAVASSPAFSPSSSLFCKTSISSPDSLTLTLNNASPSSPSSPFRLRLQKPLSSLRTFNDASSPPVSSSNTLLKRKRPTRLDIPNVPITLGLTAVAEEEQREVEVQRDEYTVYCKKGRRSAMEDRYSAVVNLQGDSKQVIIEITYFSPFCSTSVVLWNYLLAMIKLW